MSRGQTMRARAAKLLAATPAAPPLLKTTDHDGRPVAIVGKTIGAAGDRWVEPFLVANRTYLRRLDINAEVRADPELRILLHPGSRIGSMPLLNPSTQRIAAGVLVEPRFRWSALGSVFGAIGFSVEPNLGGAPMVPCSARDVPPWLLAGPVIERIGVLLRHQRRGFIERDEYRTSPRGRVDWTKWVQANVTRGKWTTFPCTFPDPANDPDLMAAVRWTLQRLQEELQLVAYSSPGRLLLQRISELFSLVGSGRMRRPTSITGKLYSSSWLAEANEAMAWVAEERGLGGARTLDGLAWDLSVEEVWEAWVSAFARDLGSQVGMVTSPFASVRRPLHWSGPTKSMGSLSPDVELRSTGRVVWIDAKYKAHLSLLRRHGWHGLSDRVQDTHRSDLHQALAYSAIADADRVDSVLAYPHLGESDHLPVTVATITRGRRQVRLVLAALPFGFKGTEQRNRTMNQWRSFLTE